MARLRVLGLLAALLVAPLACRRRHARAARRGLSPDARRPDGDRQPVHRGAGRSRDRVAARLRRLAVAAASRVRRHPAGRRHSGPRRTLQQLGVARRLAHALFLPQLRRPPAAGGVPRRGAARAAARRRGELHDAKRTPGRSAARHDLPDRAHAAGPGQRGRRRAVRQPSGVRRRRVRRPDRDHFGDRSAAHDRALDRAAGRAQAGVAGQHGLLRPARAVGHAQVRSGVSAR